MNTYGSEVLRKVSKKDHYEEFDPNQVMLSMQESPLFWYNVPILYLAKRKGDSIRHIIGVDESEKYVALTDFLEEDGVLIIEHSKHTVHLKNHTYFTEERRYGGSVFSFFSK